MYRFRRCRNRLSFYCRIYFHFWPWFEEIDIVLLDLSFSNILILIQIDILPILYNSKFCSVWIEFRNILVLVAPARPPTEKRWIRVDTKSIWISFRHSIDWKRRIWSFLNHQWHTVRIRSEMEIRILALEFSPKIEFYQKIKKNRYKISKKPIFEIFESKPRLFQDFKNSTFPRLQKLVFFREFQNSRILTCREMTYSASFVVNLIWSEYGIDSVGRKVIGSSFVAPAANSIVCDGYGVENVLVTG